jgi:hypothetical protein
MLESSFNYDKPAIQIAYCAKMTARDTNILTEKLEKKF